MLVIENAYYCEKAAELLGARFMGSGDFPIPSGCAADLSGKVWWNTRTPTRIKEDRRPVCTKPGDGKFLYGVLDTEDCPPPTFPVPDSTDCASAALELGSTYMGIAYYPIPTGCVGDETGGGKIWYNTRDDDNARARDNRRPICTWEEPVTTTEEVITLASYEFGEAGAEDCIFPMVLIDSPELCEAAASSFGATYVSANSFPIQYGCVADLNNPGRLWFNTNVEGTARDTRRPVCVEVEVVTTPEPETTTAVEMDYEYGEAFGVECEFPLALIDNAEECEAAAEYLGATYASSGGWNIQYGCVADLNSPTKIWFNTQDGTPRGHRRPVCVRLETTTEPPLEVTASEPGKFAYGEPNTLMCSGEMAEDEFECQRAAAYLNTDFALIDSSDMPIGCFGDLEGDHIWYNNDINQNPVANRRPVCVTHLYGYGPPGVACRWPWYEIESELDCYTGVSVLGGRYVKSGSFPVNSGCVAETESEGSKSWFNLRTDREPVEHRRSICVQEV